MFDNTGFLTFYQFSHMREKFPPMELGSRHVLDKWMEISEPWTTGAMVTGFNPWSRPQAHCCPHAFMLDRPQRSCRQHFVILPSLLTDPNRCDYEGGDQKSEKGAALSIQCQGKDTASSEQTSSTTTGKDATECNSNDKTLEKFPWQFSVDMKGCDEVRTRTKNGVLMIEGRGTNDNSQQMVQYITSLPHHVSHDSLTASLVNNRLTVIQKAGAYLEGQARTVLIDMQQRNSINKPEEQQQQNTEIEEQEKEISATDRYSKGTVMESNNNGIREVF